MTLIRLNKYLSSQGVASRRTIDKLIQNQQIYLNQTPATLGSKVDPDKDTIHINGKKFTPTSLNFVYYLLHKPVGYITTSSDDLGRKSVLSLLPPTPRVVAVGRLDKDTSGALLLTNDGALVYSLTHPKYHIGKTYLLQTSNPISPVALQKMTSGVKLSDGQTAPALVKKISQNSLELTIYEGKNRQIRRMCVALGLDLLKLKRLKIGDISLSTLPVGKYRPLTFSEIKLLKR